MKLLLKILLAILPIYSFAQITKETFSTISRKKAEFVLTPDSLAKELTTGYNTDREKVTSIFRWITENISYNLRPYYNASKNSPRSSDDDEDTEALKPLSERVAIDVLKKRVAFCDGYARLFKTLCDNAGIKSEIITGYASGTGRGRFHSNHRWNAVWLDSSWQLLDATWASGYLTYSTNDFLLSYNNRYFLTPARDFARDHYPEDLQWSLLPDPPYMSEFRSSPFKTHAYFRNYIQSYAPLSGVIEASVGDTLQFLLETLVSKNNMRVLDTAYVDSAIIAQATIDTAAITAKIAGNKVSYKYVVKSEVGKWLTVVMNDEVIMRYKLNIRKEAIAVK